MKLDTSFLRRHAGASVATLLLLGCAFGAWGTDSYDGASLTIPSVTVGSATYSNMVVTVGSIVSGPSGTAPDASQDSYDPASNRLTVPAVTLGGRTYYNVVVTVHSLISIGGVSGVDSFYSPDLIIPSVQLLGGAVYNNVIITPGKVISEGGGMPQNVRDVYDPQTKQLTIAAIQFGGHVYTNAVITPGQIVSVGTPMATANGTLAGAWVQAVTVTLSGGASGSTTTDANGNYRFENLPSGRSYTFTPSLSGYNYLPGSETVPIPGGSSSAVTVPVITAAAANSSYSISGTVNYAGSATGPVYILLYNTGYTCGGGCSPNGGTLIRLSGGSGTYTLRGLQSQTFTVSAFMDTLGTGQQNDAADPAGTSATISIGSANVTSGADITLSDPTVAVPAVPSIGLVSPGNASAFLEYQPDTDNSGNEVATSYTLSWGTDTNASNGGSRTFNALGTNAPVAYIPNLVNGAGEYFKVLATSPAGSSAYSAITGPVTIGQPTGGNTVSGTVTFSGNATGPMIVILHPAHGNGDFYYAVVGSQASPPASGAGYTITGVASGLYQFAILIDNNNNGVTSAGDFTYGIGGGNPPYIVVNGTTNADVTLPGAAATPLVLTTYFLSGSNGGYGLNLGVNPGSRQVVNATLISGPNVALPIDLGFSAGNGYQFFNLANGGIAPVVGQSYGILVTYADGSTQISEGSVGVVLGPDNVAQNLLVSSASGADTPTFSWSAPATPPSLTPFFYSLQNLGQNGNSLPSSVTSVDLATSGQSLQSGTYYWQVQVQDAAGNSATVQANTPYVAP